jgi:transposase
VNNPMPPAKPEEIARYEAVIAELQSGNAALRVQNAVLVARVAELERRLGLNSSNSSKPPGSDGLKKPPRTTSLREPTDKKPGGQPGHKGRTLERRANPDAIIDHFPAVCAGCGEPLDAAASTGHTARQVFDLPEPQPLVVTEHRAHQCRCAGCGAQTRAAFPDDVRAPVQYGARVATVVLYLLHFQLLPEQRLAEAMADLFGVHLSTATIAAMSRTCAARFSGFIAMLMALIAAAPVKHLDETGFRVGGRTWWLHIAGTLRLTVYRVAAKRGSIPQALRGIVVHDHWKPYYQLKGVLHALCNAHHLRELKALVEIEREDWARQMQRLLRRACHAARLAHARGEPLCPALIGLIERAYDRILSAGLAFHEAQPPLRTAGSAPVRRGRTPRRIGHNLARRLAERRTDVLRFLHDPAVPFTNNLAERDGRMMKLRQKISGGFRSTEGAQDFAVVRSLISTAKKQGWDVMHALNQSSDKLLAMLQAD